jgi:hypothetical protein
MNSNKLGNAHNTQFKPWSIINENHQEYRNPSTITVIFKWLTNVQGHLIEQSATNAMSQESSDLEQNW